jgi:uncharacterized protein (TIGR03437 family)
LGRVTAAKNGVVYLAEGYQLWRFPGDGTIRLVSGIVQAKDLAADSTGHVYASTSSGYLKITPEGNTERISLPSSSVTRQLAVGPLDELYYSTQGGFNIVNQEGRNATVNSRSLVGTETFFYEPDELAVDNSGRVYFHWGGERIQVLVPADGACPVIPSPGRLEVPDGGGTVTVQLKGGNRCAWRVEGSAPWITLASSGSGTGNGSVTLRVAANAGSAARAFAFVVSGMPILVAQSGRVPVPFVAAQFEAIGASIQPLTAPDSVMFINAAGGLAFLDVLAGVPNKATELLGTSVEINGKPAVLNFVTPDYIVCSVPRDTPLGNVTVTVKIFGMQVATGSITVVPIAPGILLQGEEELCEIVGFNPVTNKEAPFEVETPANPGEDKRTRVTFLATGIRYADGRTPDGQPVDVTSYLRIEAKDLEGRALTLPVESTAFFDDVPGADWITVVLPPEANRTSKVVIRVQAGEMVSNEAAIRIRQTGP